MGIFIPHSKLENLKGYRYQSEDRSTLSKYVLKPFWNKFVNVFPLWMAPNAVTLSGFGFVLINVITVLLLNPSLVEETPSWTYYSYAFCLFMYQTFDACDGAHARRTSQSGPLGELFDHCIDSLNTTLSMIVFCATMKCGYTFVAILIQFALLCNFYLSTWEEYHTHKLFLSEFNGPVEGIILICFSYILTGMFGPDVVWHTRITELPIFNYTVAIESYHVVFAFCGLGLLFNVISARRNVVEYYRENYAASKTTDKKVVNATYGLLPFFGFFATVFIVAIVEPRFISLPFILSNGLAMAFVVGRIIVAHLTVQAFPMINVSTFFPTILLIVKYLVVEGLGYRAEEVIFALNWMSFGLTLGIHAMFITEVIYEFTTFLDIYALSIKHPKTA